MSPEQLLALELDTLWETDGPHRLVRSRPTDRLPPPLVVLGVAVDGSAVVWAVGPEIGPDRQTSIGALVSTMRLDGIELGWAPPVAAEIAAAVRSDLATSTARETSYVLDPRRPTGSSHECIMATGPEDRHQLHGLLADAEIDHLCEPWAAVLVTDDDDKRVGAVCETARATERAVEAGVWTHERFRRRGLATAATTAWHRLVADRTVFYSAAHDNVASHGVARRLRGRPVGHWWQLRPADPDQETQIRTSSTS